MGSVGSAVTLGYLKNGFIGCAWGKSNAGGWVGLFRALPVMSTAHTSLSCGCQLGQVPKLLCGTEMTETLWDKRMGNRI